MGRGDRHKSAPQWPPTVGNPQAAHVAHAADVSLAAYPSNYRVATMRAALAAWCKQVSAQSNRPNPEFDPERFRQLYVDVDASRFDPALASKAQWEEIVGLAPSHGRCAVARSESQSGKSTQMSHDG